METIDEIRHLEQSRATYLKMYADCKDEEEKQEYWKQAEADTLNIASLRIRLFKQDGKRK